ncbi:MAG: STAS domain-containing protein [Bernardetiaceae bacterium]|jgi:anti-sigma B factor antagonist|nr:STAS domain-containing protein [Bernardetiaceae bacterium]
MEVHTEWEPDTCLLRIGGDLDASSSLVLDRALEQALAPGQRRPLVLVDCSGLQYISSPGIGVFIARLGDCEKAGTKLALFGMSEKIQRVFAILGLDQLIVIRSTRHEARAAALAA